MAGQSAGPTVPPFFAPDFDAVTQLGFLASGAGDALGRVSRALDRRRTVSSVRRMQDPASGEATNELDRFRDAGDGDSAPPPVIKASWWKCEQVLSRRF